MVSEFGSPKYFYGFAFDNIQGILVEEVFKSEQVLSLISNDKTITSVVNQLGHGAAHAMLFLPDSVWPHTSTQSDHLATIKHYKSPIGV